ncbi:hypothetical protein KEM55_002658 [Ascosphaera atra]|nr:hypothetical protein KEM55_002658 [Ascosphaera atra]
MTNYQLICFLVSMALAILPVLSMSNLVLVSYPERTPESVIQQAIDVVIDAGGVIRHKYTIIKGFEATMPQYMYTTLRTLSPDYMPVIEGEGPVSINDGDDDLYRPKK